MTSTDVKEITWTDFLRDPGTTQTWITAGYTIKFTDVPYTLAPTAELVPTEHLPPEMADEVEDMVSLRSELTGVNNTIFVSTKGYGRHGPRIKIAVDPPHTFDATSKSASMSIADYNIRGEYVPPQIVEQAKQFIELNREALLDYWENKIDTSQFLQCVKRISQQSK